MATTPGGLPYPVPTDPVSGGAAAIQALAETVEARMFIPPVGFNPPLVGTLSTTRPQVTVAFLAQIVTNSAGDGNIAMPAGLAWTSIFYAGIIGRGSTPFNITGYLWNSSTLTQLTFRVYNSNVAAASTTVVVAVTITGQRA